MRTFILTFCIYLVFSFYKEILASSGDKDIYFQICVEKCTSFRNKEKVILSWQLQGLLWNHKSDCEYGCMMNVTKERIKFNQPVLQYFGKWPLTRFFGIQEPASALFSFLHCIAQIFGWLQYQKFVNKNYEFYSLTKMQFNINMIGWICATVFHTRDFYWTEKFDYFSAAGIIALSIYTCFARIAGKTSDAKVYLFGIILLIIFSHHIYHMAFVHFDYGYNAKFLMGVGAINISIWLIWCAKNWTERRYVWKCALTMGGTLVFATLEIIDFTPIWFIFDGHSLWHMFTIPLSYMWYQFLIADALFETKKIAKLP
ncbi:post-GPI attachment to proteins factor 3-like [Hydractinia symbiolongicarpus]|uniref:post-GPI attachment to proteins factor 3-like n=1 Tax=Hydractinia symbiolongicarpus TaxID=13093 RepID=UPI00254D059B|nr:post-GPI attachment to proteins factor 3-like [Hydractinia symbiolongicarpus]